ncbi:hypothetical protein G6F57_020918 [Rhizopus arrhizus]|nr:hypothetical protein G6F57_020918 [Rhizopus arrhizus]
MEHAIGVHREYPAPVGIGGPGDFAHVQHPGHACGQADRPEAGFHPIHECVHRHAVGHIERKRVHARVIHTWRLAIGGHHRAASRCQEPYQRFTDATGRAGHQGHAAFKAGQLHVAISCCSSQWRSRADSHGANCATASRPVSSACRNGSSSACTLRACARHSAARSGGRAG